jgi:hypothetical protein
MFDIQFVKRPEGKRLHNAIEDYDRKLYEALLVTLDGTAVLCDLGMFHSSPAKGLLWKAGYRVKHRVSAGRSNVYAWIERETEEDYSPKFVQMG